MTQRRGDSNHKMKKLTWQIKNDLPIKMNNVEYYQIKMIKNIWFRLENSNHPNKYSVMKMWNREKTCK